MNGRSDEMNTGNSNQAESALSQVFGTAKQVIDRYTHCTLCGANLHFSYLTDFAKNLTYEVAKCPECGLKARQVTHRLQ